MSAAKPTAGYPSRTAAVLAMRAAGMRPREIARICRISIQAVAALEHSARRRKGRPIRLDHDILNALAEPARRRGLYPEQLAARIVATVAAEGMVDAVLDDEERSDKGRPEANDLASGATNARSHSGGPGLS